MNLILSKILNNIRKGIFLLLMSVGLSFSAVAQKTGLDTLIKRFNGNQRNSLQEKIYVHTDRSDYLTGEIIWLKVYNVDATFHKPLDISKVVYIEILSPENHPVLQTKVTLINGLGEGSIFLPASINSGNYQLRAYTNWMKNFDPEAFFCSAITIVNTFKEPETITNARSERYDAQFFPESGSLVNGLKSRVAFRVINSQGIGVEFKGEVYDQNKNLVATFKPHKFGIGNFTLTPSVSQTYTAVIIDSHGGTTTYKLPEVNEEGYVMNLRDSIESIEITVQKNRSTTEPRIPFIYLVVSTGQMIAIAEAQILQNGKTSFQINKKDLREGISQFTVFDDKLQPVAERLYFKRPEKKLIIQTLTDIPVYGKRKKVKVELTSEGNSHQPESANLSIAITRNDSLSGIDHSTIQSYLLFTSELKGRIESPEYYLETQDNEAIDNLLLTHGWRRFSWNKIVMDIKKPVPVFIPEFRGHIINGKIIDESGRPMAGVNTYLSTPGKNVQLYTSKSNEQGEIQFEMKYFYGTKRIISQAETGKVSNYRIEVKDPFSEKFAQYPLPIYQSKPEQEQQLLLRSVAMQAQDIYQSKKINNFSNPTFDSVSFYGKADETYFLENYTRFPTMEDVLREYVPGVWVRKRKDSFYFRVPDNLNKAVFKENPLVLLDGLPVFDLNKIMAFDPLKVKKLEVLTRKYYLGYSSFLGIVSFTTYRGDLGGFELDPQSVSLDYEGLQQRREFYSPKYETQSQRESRVPDQRNLLYWNPSVNTDKHGKYQFEFYTSDIAGDFQIVVEGITKNGLAGSSKSSFKVGKGN